MKFHLLFAAAFTCAPWCHDRLRGALCAKSVKPPIVSFSMPSLHFNSTRKPATSILKAMRRSAYPTIDLPLDDDFNEYFMGMALQQAELAYKSSEVPIGAVIVRECDNDRRLPNRTMRTFQVIASGYNLVESNYDASAHAELVALRAGATRLENWRYPPNSRLYCTVEPCPICLASIQAFRVDHVVFGAPDNRLGAIQTHIDLLGMAKHPYHEIKSVTGGVREEECAEILINFFRERRRKKKELKEGKGKLAKLARTIGVPRKGISRLRKVLKILKRWS